VFVAPQKFNGMSMPLLEATASGMLMMTTNRFPTNQWLPNDPLIPIAGKQMVNLSTRFRRIEECILSPVDIAKTMDEWYGRDISAFSDWGQKWATTNDWSALGPKWKEILSR
jgi:hypothetical protein